MVDGYSRRMHFTSSLKMEAADSSEMFVSIYHPTRRYIPETPNLGTELLQGLRSRTFVKLPSILQPEVASPQSIVFTEFSLYSAGMKYK
jgi:hypothetical protein